MKNRNYLLQAFGVLVVLTSMIISAYGSAVRPYSISRGYAGQILGGYFDATGPMGGGRIYMGSTFSDSSADGNIVVFTSSNKASEFVPGVSDLSLPGIPSNVFARDLRTNTTKCLSCREFAGTIKSWVGTTPRITPDGRYVVSAGMPAGQFANDPIQIFRYDLQTDTEQLVSVGVGNAIGNDDSMTPVVSDDGRYVAFISTASNLIPGYVASGGNQLFVRDMQAGQTFLASHALGSSTQAANAPIDISSPLSISSSGRYTVWTSSASNQTPFVADTNAVRDVFYFDVLSSANNIGVASIDNIGVATANLGGVGGVISPGSNSFPPQVIFASASTNIDPADTLNNVDIYRFSGNARCVSISRTGASSNGAAAQRPSISRNGRYIAFSSTASDLVTGFNEATATTPDVFVRDVQTGTTSYVSLNGTSSASTTTTGAFLPVVTGFAGAAANLYLNKNISDDGRYVAFVTGERLSGRDNAGTTDVYVRDRVSGVSILASLGNSLSAGQASALQDQGDLALAAGGRKVSFTTFATDLSPDDGTTTQNLKAYQANVSLLSERSLSDRDGDGRNDFTVFRPSEGAWYSLLDTGTGAFESLIFGESGSRIVPGDYDGDGRTDHAVFTASSGRWDILRSSDNTPVTRFFGTATDILTPADFDGDGRTDLAYFRPSTANWFILQSNSNSLRSVHFGSTVDIPVAGDYDGDNRADLAVFRPSTGDWWTNRSTNNTLYGVHWGMSGDTPLAGDFDADGKTDFTVYRNGTWYILHSRDGSYRGAEWGVGTDRPVVGDYDGDARADIAVYRPSNGTWYVLQSSTNSFAGVIWGGGADVPVPAAYLP